MLSTAAVPSAYGGAGRRPRPGGAPGARPFHTRPPSGPRSVARRASVLDETTLTVPASLRPPADPSVRAAVDRLTAEFAGRFPERLVDTVVRGSRRDLDSVPADALPEMVERLARQRLLDGPG